MWCCAPGMRSSSSDANVPTTFTLACRAPFDWDFLLDFYRARAIAGVEHVTDRRYARIVHAGSGTGVVTIMPGPRGRLKVEARGLAPSAIPELTTRLRSAFDLDRDLRPIRAHLARDRRLAPLIAAQPGLRVPGCIDAFEQGVRAILGQQISVGAARQLAARLCARWGAAVDCAAEPALERAFPTPTALATADVASLGMPRARGRTVAAFAAAVLADPGLLIRAASLDTSLARLLALPGIGPWSAHYIAMRALREPDAFPASDIGILRALAAADGTRPSAREAAALAVAWSPWRAYAAQYLWSHDPAAPRQSTP
jgi:AraC family transcriptional regulator, regulatory protein of adaptative response / DNA-3-methyladenine glycosylase II